MEYVILGAVAVVVVATVWVAYAVVTAPYFCEIHQRFHRGPVCPDCEREVENAR